MTHRVSQSNTQNSRPIYTVVKDYIPVSELKKLNASKKWDYGYNSKYDIVIISKTGELGEIYNIQGLMVGLPPAPENVFERSPKPKEQYWEREEEPKALSSIKSINQWNDSLNEFKSKWTPFINKQFEYRKYGFWFKNNGVDTYITGSHWFYLQVAKIDVGSPDFREANRIKYIHWEACVADNRCFGQIYLKIRRSGHSFEASSDAVNVATSAKNARIGLLSATGADAKKMFTDKVVPINQKLPFYFKPIMDGMDRPKTELSYKIPASKITKRNMLSIGDESIGGLDTTIDHKSTEDNSYDGEKLLFLSIDEAGKLLKPFNLLNLWRVHKTCLRLGSRIIGKCKMGSTPNALKKGGAEFKKLYSDSNVSERNQNGQTKSGLYALYIPTEWNLEGHIDRYGMPVLRTPSEPIRGIDGEYITLGAIDYWENEVDSKKNDPDELNEFYRQYSRTEQQAFRDESQMSLFNLTKIYDQIAYNESLIIEHHLTRGSFHWKDGVRFGEVVWTPDKNGRFLVSWLPKAGMQNKVTKKNGLFYPQNEHLGCMAVDPFDINAVVGGRGSNGSLHGLTKFHLDEAPTNSFFLEYIARPQTAEIFFEEVLMACHFYSMPILIESNRTRLLYHFKNSGYRPFSMNRPDKPYTKLTVTERQLGGIPSSSEDVLQSHATAIQTYIEKYVGYDTMETYRTGGEIGSMLFNRTLEDWAGFNINDREKFDASISSGFAIMANQKNLYQPEIKNEKISISVGRYDNNGSQSKFIRP